MTNRAEMSQVVETMIQTGERIGATSDFYAALAHDEDLFRSVLKLVDFTTKDPLGIAQRKLMAAVAKGVRCANGVYRFFDPGIALTTLRDLPVVCERKLIYYQDWYNGYDWGNCEDVPQERSLRIPVEGSFGKTFDQQVRLLSADEEVPQTRVVATFLVVNALATGKRLLPDRYVRTADKVSGVGRVGVGLFDAFGLEVNRSSWDHDRRSYLGLAAFRKSPAPITK